MAFDVYPATLTNPLSLATGATSTAESFTERIAAGAGQNGADAMFLRLVMLNPAVPCAPPGPDHPGIFLIANGGTPVEVLQFPAYASIFNGASQYVAAATFAIEANGVYQVTVDFLASQTGTGNSWEIQIENNALATRDFTWVVADSLAETSQPWMELPHELNVDSVLGGDILLTGQEAQIVLSVINKGTGPLNITDLPGALGGSAFQILSVPAGPINPNACDDILIQFDAPNTAGTTPPFDYDVGSNDTTATTGIPAATHNRRVALSGTAGKLEVILVLDASGSMAYLPDGTAPGVAVSDMRWGHMKTAADGFLDLLAHFADGLGRVGIVLFPDISSGPIPNPHNTPNSHILQSAIDIPADVTPIKDLLDLHTPTAGHGNTCMGFGIGTAMGTGAGSFGEFLSSPEDVEFNPRWMVVMSDGFHNLGPPDPADFYGPVGDPTSFRGKHIRVIAVSYGDPGAPNWPPDPIQMEDLRTESDGVYVDAGPNDTGADPLGDLGLNVAKSFRAAVVAGLFLDPTTDPGVTLSAGDPEMRRDIAVLPYDTKVCFAVNWATDNPERVDVQILTPNCELITPSVAQADPDIRFSEGGRYRIFTFNNEYLRNAEGQPREGTWKLVVSADGLDSGDTEPVEYEVITRSRLRMRLNAGRHKYYAGDTIDLSAVLTLDGKPIRNASVTLRAETPGNFFANWLSGIKVTPQEYDAAQAELGAVEATGIAIKSHAIVKKGLAFKPFRNTRTLAMSDPDDQGIYRASIGSSSVPGTYTFYVAAAGETPDGVAFRREQRLQMYLDVRPDPGFTLVDVVYEFRKPDQPYYTAEVKIWPRDPFGNVVLIDPAVNPAIRLSASGGELTGSLASNLDGSYSQKLSYTKDLRPVISLEVGGNKVIQRFETAPLNDITFADKLIDFKSGSEAQKGANLHTDPRAALGDVLGKDAFVSLGAHGSITLGAIGQSFVAQGDDDITVFVHSDPDLDPATRLRSYAVHALAPGSSDNWKTLGRSAGITQSFSLAASGLAAADAIRITDTSGIILEDFKASSKPGVSIMGVGFKKSGLKPGDAQGCLGCILAAIKRLIERYK